MTPKPKKNDDLTAIPGIGPARQKWLMNTFDIYTYQELAALSAEQIQNRLKEEGQIASLAAIRTWLVKAAELAAKTSVSQSDEQESRGERLITGISSLARENGWKPFASFVVEFQSYQGKTHPEKQRTAVHYMEADTGTTWPGIETSKLCQWMSDQVGVSSGSQPEEMTDSHADVVEASPTLAHSAGIKITQVRFIQPSQTPSPVFQTGGSDQEQVFMKGNKPFQGEIGYKITGAGAAEIARQPVNCTLQAFVYDMSTEKSTLLGEAINIPLKEGVFDYTASLQPVSLPHGKFRFWITVALQHPSALPDFLEIPVINFL